MIPETVTVARTVMAAGFFLSVALPLVVMAVAIRGYRRSNGGATPLRLATGIILITAVPTLLRLGFGSILPGGTWATLVIRLVQLTGLLVVLGVMHGE